jgi:hypothetical protein
MERLEYPYLIRSLEVEGEVYQIELKRHLRETSDSAHTTRGPLLLQRIYMYLRVHIGVANANTNG